MNRTEIINSLLRRKDFKRYLEIGVKAGSTFLNIKTSQKIAVDPDFCIRPQYKFLMLLRNPYNLFAKYYKTTSDDFFKRYGNNLFKTNKIDIALVDGMHEYYFVLRDILNSLRFLNKDGIILVHDCNPATESASVSFEEWKGRKFKGNWNGDVWKAIYHLKKYHRDLEVFVIDDDYGIGIIRRLSDVVPKIEPDAEIARLPYAFLANDRENVLGLKSVTWAEAYFKQHYQ